MNQPRLVVFRFGGPNPCVDLGGMAAMAAWRMSVARTVLHHRCAKLVAENTEQQGVVAKNARLVLYVPADLYLVWSFAQELHAPEAEFALKGVIRQAC